VQPRKWDESESPRPIQLLSLALQNLLNGEEIAGPITFSVDEQTRQAQKCKLSRHTGHSVTNPSMTGSVNYTLSKSSMDGPCQAEVRDRLHLARNALEGMMYIALPEGKTIDQMTGDERQSIRNPTDKNTATIKWKLADRKLLALRREAKESGEAYAQRKLSWKKDQKSWLPA